MKQKMDEKCLEYFKENHVVNSYQVKEIIKTVVTTVNLHKDDVPHANELIVQDTMIKINRILADESHEGTDEIEVIPHHVEDQSLKNYEYYDAQSHYITGTDIFRNDVDTFLNLIQEQKLQIKEAREKIIAKVNKIIDNISHLETAEIYGSYQTNLDLPWSDIDFVISSKTFSGKECLEDLNQKFEKELASEGSWVKKIDYISSAYVPIIKMVTEYELFEVKVDITYKDDSHRGSE